MRGVSVSGVKKVLANWHSTELSSNYVVKRKKVKVPVWDDWDAVSLGSVIDKHEIREVLEFSVDEHPKYPKITKTWTKLKFSSKVR